MLTRIANIMKYIKGDAILLTVNRDTLTVDVGNNDVNKVKDVATQFFKKAYTLSSK